MQSGPGSRPFPEAYSAANVALSLLSSGKAMIKSSLSRVAFGTSLVLGLFIGTAMPATACDQWLAPAQMVVTQTNGPRVGFSVIQEGTNIHGFAQYKTTRRTIIGNYSGTIVGDVFHARVLWTYSGVSAIGQYNGRIKPYAGVSDPKGYIFEGTTYDEYRQPPDLQYWNAYHFTCQPVASQAPSPPVKITQAPAGDSATAVLSHARIDSAATESASDERAAAAAPTVAFAVTHGSGPMPAICDAARSARARNSPAAPGLERQCTASGGSYAALPPADPEPAALPPVDPEPAALSPVDPAQLDALAAKGAEIAQTDPAVAEARNTETGTYYQLGFDIATGLFGDPALGAQGKLRVDADATRIRDSLSAAGQRGFDASVKFNLGV